MPSCHLIMNILFICDKERFFVFVVALQLFSDRGMHRGGDGILSDVLLMNYRHREEMITKQQLSIDIRGYPLFIKYSAVTAQMRLGTEAG